jgi:hypothetical protein
MDEGGALERLSVPALRRGGEAGGLQDDRGEKRQHGNGPMYNVRREIRPTVLYLRRATLALRREIATQRSISRTIIVIISAQVWRRRYDSAACQDWSARRQSPASSC